MHKNKNYYIRPAELTDYDYVNHALYELIKDLRGVSVLEPMPGVKETFKKIVQDEDVGKIFVAFDPSHKPVGFISLSFHSALHCGGKVTIFEELWVEPEHRHAWLGVSLVKEAEQFSKKHGVLRIEIGLPHYDYVGYKNIYQFYQHLGYVDIGPRLKKVLTLNP